MNFTKRFSVKINVFTGARINIYGAFFCKSDFTGRTVVKSIIFYGSLNDNSNDFLRGFPVRVYYVLRAL